MARRGTLEILAVCDCGRVLYKVSDNGAFFESGWTLYEPIVQQARSELRSGNSHIERVNLCEVCRGEYCTSALASGSSD